MRNVNANEITDMGAELAVTPDPAILSIAPTRKQAHLTAKAGVAEATGGRISGGAIINAGTA